MGITVGPPLPDPRRLHDEVIRAVYPHAEPEDTMMRTMRRIRMNRHTLEEFADMLGVDPEFLSTLEFPEAPATFGDMYSSQVRHYAGALGVLITHEIYPLLDGDLLA